MNRQILHHHHVHQIAHVQKQQVRAQKHLDQALSRICPRVVIIAP